MIAGVHRGRPLRAPRGLSTRPTSDRVREAIFDLLGDTPCNARVLDLYAGSGALGIEALSRGAAHATFVESNAAALASLRTNLESLGLLAAARIVRGDATRVEVEGRFDLVFADPPYELIPSAELLMRLSGSLEATGVLVMEHSARVAPPVPRGTLSVWKHRRYGGTAVTLYRHSREESV